MCQLYRYDSTNDEYIVVPPPPPPKPPSPQRVILVEQTAKIWKALMLIGMFLTLVSISSFCFCPIIPSPEAYLFGAFTGAFIYFVGRVGQFWYHG